MVTPPHKYSPGLGSPWAFADLSRAACLSMIAVFPAGVNHFDAFFVVCLLKFFIFACFPLFFRQIENWILNLPSKSAPKTEKAPIVRRLKFNTPSLLHS
jgi:hypothetical protein